MFHHNRKGIFFFNNNLILAHKQILEHHISSHQFALECLCTSSLVNFMKWRALVWQFWVSLNKHTWLEWLMSINPSSYHDHCKKYFTCILYQNFETLFYAIDFFFFNFQVATFSRHLHGMQRSFVNKFFLKKNWQPNQM